MRYLNQIIRGDCREVLAKFPENYFDSVVTDPPYGLSKEPVINEVLQKWLAGEPYDHGHGGFMGKAWDSFVPHPDVWREVYRVLKPGGHALVFAGTRTQDLMTIALRLGGFEIRDVIEWLYFSGFPKSLDVGKAFDKRERGNLITAKIKHFRESRDLTMSQLAQSIGVGANNVHDWEVGGHSPGERRWNDIKQKLGVTDEEERQFEREKIGEETKARSTMGNSALPTIGGDTVYKTWDITAPATELARKWDGWGTALKPAHEPVIVARKPLAGTVADTVEKHGTGALNIDGCRIGRGEGDRTEYGMTGVRKVESVNTFGEYAAKHYKPDEAGRFPANCITADDDAFYSPYFNVTPAEVCKKAGKKDRNADWTGAEIDIAEKVAGTHNTHGRDMTNVKNAMGAGERKRVERGEPAQLPAKNNHPTVKPTDLMAWLVRLVTPPGGVTLDPFAGSGSTLVAAKREGFGFIGIEYEKDYCEIAATRVFPNSP